MSIITEGQSCVRCKSYLFSEDDVVYCPICGAPHHRECYNALGHCALEELHGTENEYRPPEPKTEDTESKNNVNENDDINNQDFLRNNGFTVFDLLGGVPADYKIEENVTANDAKKFVLANTHRYIPKFATLSDKNKISWNWAAFLFPAAWMISRKMYKKGILCGLLTLIATLFSIPFNIAINNLGIFPTGSYMEYADSIADNFSSIGLSVTIFCLISLIFNITIRVVSALFSDYWYKNHSVVCIQRIKKNSDDLDLNFRKKGGVNILWFFLTTMVLEYIPMIIMSLI